MHSMCVCVCVCVRVCVRACVRACVCVSVKSHLTSEVSVGPENSVTYSADNRDNKFVGFSLKLNK